MPGLLNWKPTDTPFRLGALIADSPKGGDLQYVMDMRERYPDDVDLANLDHELFMENQGLMGLYLPPLYYATKKVLQSHPSLTEFGKRFDLGGLLEQPILDETTTPSSLNQMMHGMWGSLR